MEELWGKRRSNSRLYDFTMIAVTGNRGSWRHLASSRRVIHPKAR
jgi:hypothetical protein